MFCWCCFSFPLLEFASADVEDCLKRAFYFPGEIRASEWVFRGSMDASLAELTSYLRFSTEQCKLPTAPTLSVISACEKEAGTGQGINTHLNNSMDACAYMGCCSVNI